MLFVRGLNFNFTIFKYIHEVNLNYQVIFKIIQYAGEKKNIFKFVLLQASIYEIK